MLYAISMWYIVTLVLIVGCLLTWLAGGHWPRLWGRHLVTLFFLYRAFIAHVSPTFFTAIKLNILFVFIFAHYVRRCVALRKNVRRGDIFLLPGLAILLLLEFCLREREGEREKESRLHTQKRGCVRNKRNNE